MTFRRQLFRLPLLAAALLAVGCDSRDPVAPVGEGGTMSFAFSGSPSGNFSATGPFTEESNAWARGRRFGTHFDVFGLVRRSATRGDVGMVAVYSLSPGTYSIANGDADLEFWVNSTATVSDYDRICWLEEGSVTMTSITTQRVQGTFSGQGVCFTNGDETPFAVSNGQFNAPVTN
jgi:hypothetical protein